MDAIIEGTVLRAHGRVRIGTQLIHAESDTHLWSEQSSRHAGCTGVCRATSHAPSPRRFSSSCLRSRNRGSRAAGPWIRLRSRTFLKGRHFWYRRSPDALKKAVSPFQRAITLDPTHALAHAGLADAYVSIGWDLFGLSSPSENYPKARQAAQRALESIRTAPKHTPRSGAWPDNSTGTGRPPSVDFGMRSTSSRNTARFISGLSHLLRATGRTEESLAESRRALKCHPLGLVLNMHMGWHLVYSRQYEKAVDQYLKTLELDPTFILAHVFLGQAYKQIGSFTERRCRDSKRPSTVSQSPPETTLQISVTG